MSDDSPVAPTPSRRPFRPPSGRPPNDPAAHARANEISIGRATRRAVQQQLRERLNTRGVPVEMKGDVALLVALVADLRRHSVKVHPSYAADEPLSTHPWATHVLEGRLSVMREVIEEHVSRAPRQGLTATILSA